MLTQFADFASQDFHLFSQFANDRVKLFFVFAMVVKISLHFFCMSMKVLSHFVFARHFQVLGCGVQVFDTFHDFLHVLRFVFPVEVFLFFIVPIVFMVIGFVTHFSFLVTAPCVSTT